MEEETRPLNEREKKIVAEMKIVEKLQKEEGCKLLDCGVVTNNVNLRIEIIDLKRKVREQEKVIELLSKELSHKKGMIKKICNKCIYDECIESKFETCIIEHFTRKAKGELDEL